MTSNISFLADWKAEKESVRRNATLTDLAARVEDLWAWGRILESPRLMEMATGMQALLDEHKHGPDPERRNDALSVSMPYLLEELFDLGQQMDCGQLMTASQAMEACLVELGCYWDGETCVS